MLGILNYYYDALTTDVSFASSLSPYSSTEQINATRQGILNSKYYALTAYAAIATALVSFTAPEGEK